MREMPGGLVRWVGWALLVAFLVSVFLFCLFTLALILVAMVLSLVHIAMGYRPDAVNPLVTVLGFLTVVGGSSVVCVQSYLALRLILGTFWRSISVRRRPG
jgi:cation transporter-like permease